MFTIHRTARQRKPTSQKESPPGADVIKLFSALQAIPSVIRPLLRPALPWALHDVYLFTDVIMTLFPCLLTKVELLFPE